MLANGTRVRLAEPDRYGHPVGLEGIVVDVRMSFGERVVLVDWLPYEKDGSMHHPMDKFDRFPRYDGAMLS